MCSEVAPVSAATSSFEVAAKDPLRHTLGSIALHWRGDVGVDLPRHEGARVVEPVADDLDVDALVQTGEDRYSNHVECSVVGLGVLHLVSIQGWSSSVAVVAA